MKAIQHLKTINHHKKLVMEHCFKVGLYRQGLLHDLSKYAPSEFLVGCRYYQGTRSPNNAEREVKGYSSAWLHHKGRNKHHYEYWIDYSNNLEKGIVGQRMPVKYVVEMFMDRIAASKTYQGENYTDRHPLEYYEKGAANVSVTDFGILCISRDRILSESITSGTQAGIIPRSSPQASIPVESNSSGSFLMADSRQKSL